VQQIKLATRQLLGAR